MGGDMVLLTTMGITGAASLVFSLFMVRIELWQSTGAFAASQTEDKEASC